MSQTVSISLHGQVFSALAQKALYWVEQKSLLISDLHLGRAAHLRRNGIAMTDLAHADDLIILNDLVQKHPAEKVFILGDLFHSRTLGDVNELKKIISNSNAQWILIKGNHDVFNDETYLNLGFHSVHPFLQLNHIKLIHEPSPEDLDEHFCISGHLHPGYRLKGRGRQSLKVPCFWIRKNHVLLPAFGETTGLLSIKPSKMDQIILCLPNRLEVIETNKR